MAIDEGNAKKKQEEVVEDDNDDDPVVCEVPVFLAKALEPSLQLWQVKRSIE